MPGWWKRVSLQVQENSNKKHAAFGKYKGRINNYLAKRGYNLTKEREEWAKRVKARGGTL